MKDGYFTVTKVQCDGCRHMFQVPPNFVNSLEHVWQIAENVHAASGIICGTPILSATYVPTLVSDDLAERIDAVVEEARLINENKNKLIVPPSANGTSGH